VNNKSNGHGSGRDGFTLIETIVAIMIFGVASVAFTYGYLSALRASHTAENHYSANNIARNRIARAMTLGYDSMWVLGETSNKVDSAGIISSTGTFWRTTSVTAWGTNANEIVVKVEFKTVGSTNLAAVEHKSIIALGM
jgi:prepilin-type N-terminal cleavage/methylation domain-containing protein